MRLNEFESLILESLHLWWPVGFGDPALYNVNLVLMVDGAVSDADEFQFGVREITTDVSQNATPGRRFYINEKRIHMLGWAWVPDLLVYRDPARYEKELCLSKQAKFNTVRIWGGEVTQL